MEGFSSISQDAQNALSFQLPADDLANDLFGDYGGFSPSKDLNLFSPQGILQAESTLGREIVRIKPAKRRRLKPTTATTSASSNLKTEKIVGLLAEALRLDDTFSTDEFKHRMSRIKQLLSDGEGTCSHASTPRTRGHPEVSRSPSSTPLMRNGVLADQSGSSTVDFSGFSETDVQSRAPISSVTGSECGQRKRGISPPAAEYANSMFQCTFPSCNLSCKSKGEWKRHEETVHWKVYMYMCLECNIWISDLTGQFAGPLCAFCQIPFPNLQAVRFHILQCEDARDGGNCFWRRDKLVGHVRKEHKLPKFSEEADGWKYELVSNWPRQCGFCGEPLLDWETRAKHVTEHFLKGHNISEWKIPFPRPKDNRNEGPGEYHNGNDDDDDDDDSEDDGGHDTDPDCGAVMDETAALFSQPRTTTNTRIPPSGTRWRFRSDEQDHFQVFATHSHHEHINGEARAKGTSNGKTVSNSFFLPDQVSKRNGDHTTEILMNSWIDVPRISILLQKYLSEQQLHERLLLGMGRVPNVTHSTNQAFKDVSHLLYVSTENNEAVSRRPNERTSVLGCSTMPIMIGKSERGNHLKTIPPSSTDSESQAPSSLFSSTIPSSSPSARDLFLHIGPTEPINYGYEIYCEFEFVGCELSFHPNQIDMWISHSSTHFISFDPPPTTACIFCDTLFESSGDRVSTWKNRMRHIADHYRQLSRRSDARPDFWTIEYMRMKRIITHEDYKSAIRNTERPYCDGLVPFGYETKDMRTKQERSLREVHDAHKEERYRLRQRREVKGKGRLMVFGDARAKISDVVHRCTRHQGTWTGSPNSPVFSAALKQPEDERATLQGNLRPSETVVDTVSVFKGALKTRLNQTLKTCQSNDPKVVGHQEEDGSEHGSEDGSEDQVSNWRAHFGRALDEGVKYRRVPDNEDKYVISKTSSTSRGTIEVRTHRKARYIDEKPRASNATYEDYAQTRSPRITKQKDYFLDQTNLLYLKSLNISIQQRNEMDVIANLSGT